jgi:hypothetical protein
MARCVDGRGSKESQAKRDDNPTSPTHLGARHDDVLRERGCVNGILKRLALCRALGRAESGAEKSPLARNA